ncbi:MAG TPA: CPBP family intramembrane glutamic endopeptidase [Planctomycetota bacterium]|nr:CPBP family intramembrane glutamic endopeptidase [Planctomycetota bacterium]
MKLLEHRTRPRPSAPATDVTPDWGLRWVLLLPALLVVLQLLGAAVLAPFRPLGAGTILLLTGSCDLLLLGMTWGCLCFRRGHGLRILGLVPPARSRDLFVLPLAGVLLAILGGLGADLVYRLFSGGAPPPPQRTVQWLGGIHSAGLRILAILVVGGVAPIVEEVVFRGVVFRTLRERAGLFSSVVLSSILFALAHLDPDHALHLFAIGAVLAWIVSRCGSLYPGMILHSAINLSALFLAW